MAMQKALLMGQKDGHLRQAKLKGKLDLCAAGSTWYPTLTFCPLVFVVSVTECKRAFKLGLTSNAVLHEALFNDPHFHFHIGQIDHTEGGRGALVESGVEKIVQCFIHLKRKLREHTGKLPSSWDAGEKSEFIGNVFKCFQMYLCSI